MKIVVTGGVGSGKSTVVRAVLDRLGWRRPGGYATHWGGGERGGGPLYFQPWGGVAVPMARRTGMPAGAGGLPYELQDQLFVPAAVASWTGAMSGQPVVIDELGLMETGSADFARAVAGLWRERRPVLAVIQRRALDHWLGIIGRDGQDRLLEVDEASRAGLPGTIAGLLRG
jgi:nucleoside-triphosphatase THEP1